MDCIFCKVVNKEAPATFVYEDSSVAVIIPKQQVNDGHVLVLPKQHYRDIFDIDETILKDIIVISKKVAEDAVADNDFTAVNILNASGVDAQQSVFHFHFHVVPRRENDGLDMWIKQNL